MVSFRKGKDHCISKIRKASSMDAKREYHFKTDSILSFLLSDSKVDPTSILK